MAAGVTSAEIQHRLGTGALLREYRGVFRVGHRAPSIEAWYLAAVRACGDEAVLSGRAAAHLHGLVKGSAPAPEVTCPRTRRVRGVVTHEARRTHPQDVTVLRRIPVTSVARTLIDLAASLRTDALARACHEAGVRYGTTPADLQAVLKRRSNTPGARKLRRIISGDEPATLSRLEARFLALVVEADLPRPVMNRAVGKRRVDCRWPDASLTVELDGYRYHSSRHAWENDRRREREARARGDDFRRYSYGDVYEEPAAMLAELDGLLSGCRAE